MEIDYREVARVSGLSVATVTDHLTGRAQVSEPTRRKIQRAMALLYTGTPAQRLRASAESLAATTLQAMQVGVHNTAEESEARRFIVGAQEQVRVGVDLLLKSLDEFLTAAKVS